MHLAFLVAARLGQDLLQLQDAGPVHVEVTVTLGDLGQSDGGHGGHSMENAAAMPAKTVAPSEMAKLEAAQSEQTQLVEGMYYNLALHHSGDLASILKVAGGDFRDIWHTGPLTQGLEFGIWHTGVKVFGKEYFYNSAGIHTEMPGYGVLMPGSSKTKSVPVPHTAKALGETTKSEAELNAYLDELRETKFTADAYDLLQHNCNHFADEVAKFLLGEDAGSPIGDDEEASPIGGDVLNFGSNLEAFLSKNPMIGGMVLDKLKTAPNVHGEAVDEADSGVKVVQMLLQEAKKMLDMAAMFGL